MKHFTLPYEGGLKKDLIPKDILHGFDKIPTEIFEDSSEASRCVAELVLDSLKKFDRKKAGRNFKLGLTTGASPVSLYKWLAKFYREGKISFADVDIFSIDEYYPCSSADKQSRNNRLHEEFIDKVDVKPGNVFIPDGSIPESEISEYCAGFDERAREMDLLIMGLGPHCEVAFNAPGAARQSKTRVVQLSYAIRKVQARNFNGEISKTPKSAISIGLSTMMSARKVVLLAWGEKKAQAVYNLVETKHDSTLPATCFQFHSNVQLFVDEAAGSLLTREVAPWLIGPCDWTPKFRRKAVVWLCQKLGKPILKLTQDDYLKNGLGELIDLYGPYDKINISIFNDLQHLITGWPGGKPDSDDSTRPVSSKPFPKTVLIFSPHPDDDVISMGGTFIRLVHQGHNVHVAYETSGDLAVHDDVVIQHMDAAAQLGFEDRLDEVKKIIASKVSGAPEPKELLAIKAAIRRSEARGADRSFGLEESHVHFLNLPFYESGGVTKLPRTQADVDIIKQLINELKPDQIYMAGDLADPHGTHRVCTEAALTALDQIREEGGCEWLENCHVWLYRGAWMEWELGRVDMAVPLSPDEVVEKRHAIYHHLSQKDIVPFPGDDPREFWQRAEERTSNTAKLYDQLGMAEYQAIEVFLKLF